MPWCPKCKNEYVEGIKVCADCGCELVEELELFCSLIFGDEEQMTALKGFLESGGIKDVRLKYDETEAVYDLQVRKEEQKKAAELLQVFLIRENKRKEAQEAEAEAQEAQKAENAETEEQEAQAKGDSEPDAGANVGSTAARAEKAAAGRSAVQSYQDSAERAEENRSSAWMLLLAGAAGLVVVALGIAGIIPFQLGNAYLFYGVLSAVFILFIVMGVISMKNAKIFAKKAESESNLQESLLKWCRESLQAEMIDARIGKTAEDTEETLYFRRCEQIKGMLNHQFMNLDQALLDHFIDEKVYDMLFSE